MGLKVSQLISGYRQTPVLHEVSFEMQVGQTVALLGLNGAGKSTLLKTILGLLPAQSGSVSINGVSIQDNHQAYAQQLAYIPETPILYEELTLREHLDMVALGYGIPQEVVMERALPLLKIFRLENQLNWFPTHFSKGMTQKVMIICALVTDAKLLIIDEPFLGLDTLAIEHFKELLVERAQAGTMVLFTTHLMSMAEEMSSRYLLLEEGRLVADGNLETLQEILDKPGMNLRDLYLSLAQESQSYE